MQIISFKKWLKLGWSAGWTEKEDKAHKAAYLLGINEGLRQARERNNLHKRKSRLKKKLAKQASQA